jgi:hypothetical protein
MTAAWVAGATRARAMLAQRVGADAARELAAASGIGDAVRRLGGTAYRRGLEPDADLRAAQRAVSGTLLWQLRVLAGWLPQRWAWRARLFAAGFEIANIEALRRATAEPEVPPYRLGALATAWPRLSAARSPAELRQALAASPWGDPGDDSAAALATGLRVSAAVRTALTIPQSARWAAGRLALVVARERFVLDRRLTAPCAQRAARVLGSAATAAADYDEYLRRLPAVARWACADVTDPAELWQAEARWWTTLEQEGAQLLRVTRPSPDPVVGAVALLSADVWRVRAALEFAARGGGTEDFDALV